MVRLQAGDADTLRLWHELVDLSKRYFNRIYGPSASRSPTTTSPARPRTTTCSPSICDELEAAGIAMISDGALCVFLDGFTGREGKPVPLIIRKSDGGYGYAHHRPRHHPPPGPRPARRPHPLRHRRPQALHFQMVFDTARMAGWLPDDVEVEHVQIGNVLGPDGKILRTRTGDPIKLMDLLDEAVDRAGAVLDESRPDPTDEVRAAIAHQVGIGAVKYADLSVAHDSEYVFDFDRMLVADRQHRPLPAVRRRPDPLDLPQGRTRPDGAAPIVARPSTRSARWPWRCWASATSCAQVGDALEPHRLCGYLFELARLHDVLRAVPGAQADDDPRLPSRPRAVTLAVLVQGLALLGIAAPERM